MALLGQAAAVSAGTCIVLTSPELPLYSLAVVGRLSVTATHWCAVDSMVACYELMNGSQIRVGVAVERACMLVAARLT